MEIICLAGAAGTVSAMGASGRDVRAALATALRLGDPGDSRHSTRDHIAALAAWLTMLTGSLGKMGADLTLMAQSGIEEITLSATGVSSTMPQKANPVAPSVLVAVASQVAALNSAVQGALVHQQQRDGAAWFVEWMSLPQMVLLSARALGIALDLGRSMAPNRDAMETTIEATGGLIFAEALTFALAKSMPRPEAARNVKAHSLAARSSGKRLEDIVKAAHADIDLTEVFDAGKQLGTAPDDARAFARTARK